MSNQVEHFFKLRQKYGIKPGLERVNSLLASVGHPEKSLKAIHVTGTNGKGSTIAFLNDSLLASDYNVGVFSSPSMTGLYGHIKINDEQISTDDFAHCLNELKPHIKRLDDEHNHPSEFEIITVIALLYFQNKVDIALIETGMGGRQDTTNCVLPIISIITTISIDHTQFLGDSLVEITNEKAGIIKRNVPIIIGQLEAKSVQIVMAVADRLHAPLHMLGRDFTYEVMDQHLFLYNDSHKLYDVQLQMNGEHQYHNATIAIKALILLTENGYDMQWKRVFNVLRKTTIPGRFEKIHHEPYIILDGAHNESSMKALVKTVRKQFINKKIHIIFAAFKDKLLTDIVPLIDETFATVTVTTFNHPRAITTEQLAHYFHRPITKEKNWQQIVDHILARKDDDIYIFTGSLHFIFLVRQYINELI